MATWIETAPAAEAFLTAAGAADRAALDTEFMRERTFRPQLALVQIAIGDAIGLFDAPAFTPPPALLDLLRGPTLKIMHSASEDLEALRCCYGAVPTPLFDTQIAATLAGVGAGLGYQKLVRELLGVELDKGETRSDWLRRPLSPEQCRYAADDVRHLDAVYRHLADALDRLGRRAWLDEDCARLVAGAQDDRIDPNPHLDFRPAQRMQREAQLRLRRLLVWRDLQARRSDKPRSWILDNDLVVRLAERPPIDRSAMDRLLDGSPRAPRKGRDELWTRLVEPLTAEELDLPLAAAAVDLDRGRVKKLQGEIARIADEQQLPPGFLLPRRHLETLIETGEWPAAASGWRRPLLEPALAPLLAS